MTASISKPVLLPTSYLPPVLYFALATNSCKPFIERHESYTRQTIRNRCCILAANGPLRLSIPVSGNQDKHKTADKKTSLHNPWQMHHWKSICSAYNKAPYFIYYRDMLEAVYQKPFSGFLVDWNSMLCKIIATEMGMNLQLEFTSAYQHQTEGIYDLRDYFGTDKATPRSSNTWNLRPYQQVFEHKFGFIPNASIIDLLFNLGPDAAGYLQESAAIFMDQLREG